MKHTLFALFAAAMSSLPSSAQKIPLINSQEVLAKATALRDSAKYDLAIKELLVVPPRDTNYFRAKSELAQMYLYNKQYDLAIATADWMLARKTEHRASMFDVKATAYEGQKDFDKAFAVLEPALKEFPLNVTLRYQLAKTYHNKRDFPKAIKAYFDVLEIAPFSSNAHLNLGHISVWTGQKTHALLSLAMYIALVPNDNSKLQYIESLSKNEVDDEGGGSLKPTGNAFERLDQILKSKIALDAKFKTEIPIDNVATVRQMEMLLQQLNTVSTSADDPWLRFYLPIYTTIRDQKLAVPFVYHLLTSTSIEDVAKWNEKNQSRRETFFNTINQLLVNDRESISLPASLGAGATGTAEYFEDQNVYGVGQKKDGQKHDKWVYFYSTGQVSGEGRYNAGKKIGEWKYYSANGSPTSSENMDTGEVIIFYPDGAKQVQYVLKNGEADGDILLYFPCGIPSEKIRYQAGKRHGKGQLFHENGVVKMDYEYSEGQKVNTWTEYYPSGKVKERKTLKDNLLDGPSETFWPDGKVKSRDTYAADLRNGPSETFHENGKLETKGEYANDLPIGEWIHYNPKGEKMERQFYNKEGKIDGEQILYSQGKVWVTHTMKNGALMQMVWQDASGKEISKSGAPDGTFKAKHFYETGQLLLEGSYKNGKKDGKWTKYYIDGPISAVNYYVDGQMDGEQTEYFRNGKKKSVAPYKNGIQDGYSQLFFSNGTINSHGWNVNGKSEQQWLSYYPDGQLATDQYFQNNLVHDTAYFFNNNGKQGIKMFYEKGKSMSEVLIDPIQQLVLSTSKMNEPREYKYESGAVKAKYKITCGRVDGTLERFYADGKLGARFGYASDTWHGVYEEYDEMGVLAIRARHENGVRQGLWTRTGELGKIEQSIPYGNGSTDSLVTHYYKHGPVSTVTEYYNDERNGVSRSFAPDGTPVVEKRYVTGQIYSVRSTEKNGQFGPWKPFSSNLQVVAYYPNGTKAYEEQYAGGSLSGTRRIYFPNGKPCKEYNFVDGDANGPFTDYYPNGKICVKGQHRFDEFDGVVEVFDENGVPLKSVSYSLGKKNGPTILYSKGVKSKEVEYYYGAPLK